MNLLDDLCSCNHRAFEDAERLAQVLLLREDVWQRCQDLLDEPVSSTSDLCARNLPSLTILHSRDRLVQYPWRRI